MPFSVAIGGNAEKQEDEEALLNELREVIAGHLKIVAYARFSGSHSGEHNLRSK
jgi:hypothetical protein